MAYKFISLIIAFFLLSGCATQSQIVSTTPLPQPTGIGVYHRVLSGETLWRIAKAYDVDISGVIDANRLRDPSRIEAGQMLFIPGAEKTKDVKYYVPAKKGKLGFIWPARGRVISYFGQKRHNVVNAGIDILSKKDEIVVASRKGTVSFCDDKVKGFGRTIIIDHGNGYSTVYAYNSINLVKPGQPVKQGEPIARVGKSARSDKHTLHFEIRKNHKPKNPFYYLP